MPSFKHNTKLHYKAYNKLIILDSTTGTVKWMLWSRCTLEKTPVRVSGPMLNIIIQQLSWLCVNACAVSCIFLIVTWWFNHAGLNSTSSNRMSCSVNREDNCWSFTVLLYLRVDNRYMEMSFFLNFLLYSTYCS